MGLLADKEILLPAAQKLNRASVATQTSFQTNFRFCSTGKSGNLASGGETGFQDSMQWIPGGKCIYLNRTKHRKHVAKEAFKVLTSI